MDFAISTQKLIDLIPVKYYSSQTFAQNPLCLAPKQTVKDNSKKGRKLAGLPRKPKKTHNADGELDNGSNAQQGAENAGAKAPLATKQDLIRESVDQKFQNIDLLNEASTEKPVHLFDKLLAKSRGEKVHDNPKLIQKSIRKKASKKNKSAIEWKQRQKDLANEQNQKQQKRNQNIQEKLLQRKQGKTAGAKSAKTSKSGKVTKKTGKSKKAAPKKKGF